MTVVWLCSHLGYNCRRLHLACSILVKESSFIFPVGQYLTHTLPLAIWSVLSGPVSLWHQVHPMDWLSADPGPWLPCICWHCTCKSDWHTYSHLLHGLCVKVSLVGESVASHKCGTLANSSQPLLHLELVWAAWLLAGALLKSTVLAMLVPATLTMLLFHGVWPIHLAVLVLHDFWLATTSSLLPVIISINVLKWQLPLGWTHLLDNDSGASGAKLHGCIVKTNQILIEIMIYPCHLLGYQLV
jgi:hypothetical protein